MEPLANTLLLCSTLALVIAAPAQHLESAADEVPDRCKGVEFDAITPDEKGDILFFKGNHLWRGFHGSLQLSKASFNELDELNRTGHVDAAFRMHNTEKTGDHDHIYLFMDDKVFRYYNDSLEDGYPKKIQQDFPKVPSHLDAAVECPKGECITDTVLFMKGNDVYSFDIATKIVKVKSWPCLPVCTSALRWLEHYYCFHGHNFTRFNPVSGEVSRNYPKDARSYFMQCDDFGHGGHHEIPKCSEIKIDAITSDDIGKSYLFSGGFYMRLDTKRDGLHPFPITRAWKEVTNGVDAVFSFTGQIYIIKDDKVYIYKSGGNYTLIEGYPKSLKDELNIEGHVDSAFVCPGENTVHIIQGNRMHNVDLHATPRQVTGELPLPLSNIDAVHCGPDGIYIFKGSQYYHYDSVMTLAVSKMAPFPQNITSAMMGCQD